MCHDGAFARRRVRVLVIDDSQDMCDSTALLLKLWGHEASVATDGPAGLDAVAAFKPHVILLDISMPGMDGYEVARRLRQDTRPARPLLVSMLGLCRHGIWCAGPGSRLRLALHQAGRARCCSGCWQRTPSIARIERLSPIGSASRVQLTDGAMAFTFSLVFHLVFKPSRIKVGGGLPILKVAAKVTSLSVG